MYNEPLYEKSSVKPTIFFTPCNGEIHELERTQLLRTNVASPLALRYIEVLLYMGNNCVNHWTDIFLEDSIIHLSNNWGLDHDHFSRARVHFNVCAPRI